MSANWHRDPLGRAEYRWFDGTNWTLRVATGGVESTEPESASLAEFAGPPPPPIPPPAMPPSYGVNPSPVLAYDQQIYGGPSPANIGKGRLLAAGVLSIISGVVWALIGIVILSLSTSDIGGLVNDASGGLLTVFFLFFVALGGGFIASGWGACLGKMWAQISIIALGGVSMLLSLIGMFDNGDASGVIPILWFGTMVGLAVSAKPNTFGR